MSEGGEDLYITNSALALDLVNIIFYFVLKLHLLVFSSLSGACQVATSVCRKL